MPVAQMESEKTDAATSEKITIPRGKKAQVRTVVSYEAELDNENQNTPETDDQTNGQNAHRYNDIPFRPFVPPSRNRIKENTLAAFFDALAEAGEENYLVMITRLPDLPNENYSRPQSVYPVNFPPMQCSVNSLPSFVQEIQKLNGRSGGRFEIRACYLTGESIEDAELTNFTVPDPVNLAPAADPSQNNLSDILAIIDRMNAESNARLERVLLAIKPERSELDELARTVMIKKLTDDPPPARDNPESVIMQMMLMPQMVEAFSEKMREAMNAGKAESDSPTWLKLLESPMGAAIGERIGVIAENFSQFAVASAAAKANAVPVSNPAPPPAESQPQAVQPQPETITETDEMTELIKDIFDELENGEPFNDQNEFLLELKEEYPMEASFVKMLCNDEPFPKLVQMLATKVPYLFEPLMALDPNGKPIINEHGQQALTERGSFIFNRLQEFYQYMRGEMKAAPSDPVPDVPAKSKTTAKASPDPEKNA